MADYKYSQDWQRGHPHYGYYPYPSGGAHGHHHHGHPAHNNYHYSHGLHHSYGPHSARPQQAYRSGYGPWGPDMPVMKSWHSTAAGKMSRQGYVAQVDTMLAHLSPAVQHSMREVGNKGIEHAVKEGSLLGYLMGKGYSFHDAVDVVESGEVGGLFIG
ncbi:MAG: hypothetical protein FWG14_10280 [Peptococcaceae bacterium]|nr:hypothetical protein [Peptococcaceae bacterium]